MRRTRTASTLVAALLLLTAGCSSDRSGAGSGAPPTDIPTSAPRLAIDGSYSVVLTVVESALETEPVGATTEQTWTVDVDCPTFPCTGTITTEGGAAYAVRWDGSQVTGRGTTPGASPCPEASPTPSPGGDTPAVDESELVLSFQPGDDGAVAMDGRLATSPSRASGEAGCTASPPAGVVADVSGTREA